MAEKQTNQINYNDESSREKSIKKNRYSFLIEYRSSSTFIFATVFITLLSNVRIKPISCFQFLDAHRINFRCMGIAHLSKKYR
jgi:hypothetical protein